MRRKLALLYIFALSCYCNWCLPYSTVVCLFCLFVLLALNAMNMLYVNSFWRGCLFSLTNFIPAISSLHCLLSQVFGWNMSPFRAVLCSFCLIFFVLEFRGIYFGVLFLVLLLVLLYLFSFPFFFWTFDVVFAFWPLSSCRWICLFLLFSCCNLHVCHLACLWTHMCRLQHPLCLKKTLNTLWCSNGGRAIFEFMFPAHMIVHNYVLRDHQSLLLRLLGASASPCTYPNPS